MHGHGGARPQGSGLVRFLIVRRICFNSGNGVVAAKPAAKINLGTAAGAEGVKFLRRKLLADGAGPPGPEMDRLGHYTSDDGLCINVWKTG